MNRKKLSVAVLAIALSVGTVSTASANQVNGPGNGQHMGSTQFSSVLSTLVKAGTITQAQSDAITSALATARTERISSMSANRTAEWNLIASTLGMDVATIQAKVKAGASLASVAGAKTNDLITALVALESTQIDAAVAAGKITSAQATAKKANLVAQETRAVNAVSHFGFRGMHKGGASFTHSQGGSVGGLGMNSNGVGTMMSSQPGVN
jgi:polyhydroxyalkanoate synthesis regulator phasin